jgi:sugar phosphate permease
MTQTSVETGPSRYRWVVFALLAGGYLLVYFHRLCPAVVALDMMEDLHAEAWLMGLLGSAYFYPYALMQIPSGLLSDSWGPRKTITVFFLLAGVASILFGMVDSVQWAIGARVLVGVGVAMLFVPTMKVLTHWFKISEFAMMTGVLMAVGGLGALSAASPLAWLSGEIGWRSSFMIIGVVTLAMAVGIWFFVRNRPEDMGLPPVEAVLAEPGEEPKTIGLRQGMWMVARTPRFWALAIWFFFAMGIFFSFGGLWGGPYLMQVYGMSKVHAGGVLSMLAVAMIFGSPLLSFLSDRVFRSRKVVLMGCSAGLVLLTLPLALAPAAMTVSMLYGWMLLMGFFGSSVVVIGFTAVKELFPVRIAGTAVGLVNLFPFLGGAVMQPVIGLALDMQGRGPEGYSAEAYGSAFFLYLVSAVISLVAAFFIKETMPRKSKIKV